jgi:SAM-dependent methyltransferase
MAVTQSPVDLLLSSCLHEPSLDAEFYIPRFQNRLSIVDAWSIPTGQHLLDIGCGQGESSLALALAVSSLGHITALDPAQPEYGTPFTVAESHSYILKSSLGPHISFRQSDVPSFFSTMQPAAATPYNAACLLQSLMYFPTLDSVRDLFQTLAHVGIVKVYVAEYTFTAANEAQIPHYLAARAQALFYNYQGPHVSGVREQNVRAAPSPKAIEEAASKAGYIVSREGKISPAEKMKEGYFEARHVAGNNFRSTVLAAGLNVEQEAEILSYVPKIKDALKKLEEQDCPHGRAMDTWWAEFTLRSSDSDT